MNTPAGWQIEDRSRRHVRRTRLCVHPGAPRHRLVSTIEEALRLAALPGENEGRTYYFRRLRLAGLPADGDRRAWLDAFQCALTKEASAAIHGTDPRADLAPAVFFRSRQEALEILLHRVVERRVVREWFWPMVTGETEPPLCNSIVGTPASGARMIPAIVEALRSTPASWVSVATAIFAAPRADYVYMLQAIPVATAQAWLEEMDGRQPLPAHVEPRISTPARRAVQPALQVFGFDNARVVWLTALAILHESPAEIAGGTVVERSRMALRALVAGGYAPHGIVIPQAGSLNRPNESKTHAPGPVEARLSLGPAGDAVSPATRFPPAVSDPSAPPPASLASSPASTSIALTGGHVQSIPASLPHPAALVSVPTPADPASPPRIVTPAAPDTFQSAPLPWHAERFATKAAGLFFLLNALKRIGIVQAFAAGLAAAYPDFLALLFERLAAHAGAAADDPIVVWVASLVGDASNHSALPCEVGWWPSNLSPSRKTVPVEFLLRVWVLAVRRWCWRTGRITVREIVARHGVFSVNRTDLDVSLPLDETEIRIRRIGLDLDPGWLPWFGRVVRFHYLYQREFHG